MIERFGVKLPEAKDLPALPRRIVLHWTGGGPRANAVDRDHYHFIVEADGRVVPGVRSVAANMRQVGPDRPYAAHTGGFNSYSVGLSAAGMADYESRFSTGRYPLTRVQVHRLCEVAAYFCQMAGLNPLDPSHLFTHKEAWTIHRVKGAINDQKLDIEYLPYAPNIRPDEAGPHLRAVTAEILRTWQEVPIPAVTPKLAPRAPAGSPTRARTVPSRLEHVPLPARPKLTPIPEEEAVIVQPKPASKSRTMWLNGITAVLSVVAIAGDALNIATQTGLELPEGVSKYVLAAVAFANLILRKQTTQPIGDPQSAY